MSGHYFTDNYFERLLLAAAEQELLRQEQRERQLQLRGSGAITSPTSSACGSTATSNSGDAFGQADHGSNKAAASIASATSSTIIKRHQRPAHKQAEQRRLGKIRNGVEELSRVCGLITTAAHYSPEDQRHQRHQSEASLLRRCADRIRAVELELTAQLEEIERHRAVLSGVGMPSSQAIDYVQTRWLEKPRQFELFYKLIGENLTDAFIGHLQSAAGEEEIDCSSTETFPQQWLSRVATSDVLLSRSTRRLEQMRTYYQLAGASRIADKDGAKQSDYKDFN